MHAEYTDTTLELRRDSSIRNVELDDSRGDGKIERRVGIRGSVRAEIRKKGVSTMKRNVARRWKRDETICVRTSVLEPIVTIPIPYTVILNSRYERNEKHSVFEDKRKISP